MVGKQEVIRLLSVCPSLVSNAGSGLLTKPPCGDSRERPERVRRLSENPTRKDASEVRAMLPL
jgi:hypothetical protein